MPRTLWDIARSFDDHLKVDFTSVMRKIPPSLDSLRVLSACVRYGNFSKAAAELRITPTAVSQRMRSLEERLGAKLFRRHGPKLTTTSRAKSLGQRVDQALSLINAAVDDFRRIKTPLRVTCAPTFAARWLIPRLGAYHALPGADAIALDVTQDLLPVGACDVAVRSGTGAWPGYGQVNIMSEERTPMLNPTLLAQRKRINVRRLLELPLIADPCWQEWFKVAGVPRPKPNFVATRFPNYELEAQAAVQGIGVALLSPILFADLLSQKALIAPFPQRIAGANSYWLLWAPESANSHFVNWMKSQFSVV
jgi:LysR family transcriptional regulator, glycine cleavage system transcriptional activator